MGSADRWKWQMTAGSGLVEAQAGAARQFQGLTDDQGRRTGQASNAVSKCWTVGRVG